MLYFAYGMNTNRYEMRSRCPQAISQGHARLLDACFRFSTHADIVECDGSAVDGVLWDITDDCLTALDQLEGYPFYYGRREFEVEHGDEIKTAIAYYMQPGKSDSPPNRHYLNVLIEGYTEHGAPLDQIEHALAYSLEFP
jgi:gamma-glutamylcyclotransferase (GGCT)/AIG2-like uncharacterized protein YtfP